MPHQLFGMSVGRVGSAHTDRQNRSSACVCVKSEELDKIKGLKSEHHAEVLGYSCGPEVAFRDDIIFVSKASDQDETPRTRQSNRCAVYLSDER